MPSKERIFTQFISYAFKKMQKIFSAITASTGYDKRAQYQNFLLHTSQTTYCSHMKFLIGATAQCMKMTNRLEPTQQNSPS